MKGPGATELTAGDIASLDLQMKMLVYQTLDHFDEKQKLRGPANPVARGGSGAPAPQLGPEPTYQGKLNFLVDLV
jgi:hypothetical protein